MRFLIDVNHPAHVHLFRCAAQLWLERGEAALFTATDKDVTVPLLQAYGLPHEVLYRRGSGKLALAQELAVRTLKLAQVSRRFRPDVILSMGSPTAAWGAFLTGHPHVAFEDTEDSIGQIWLYLPFTRYVLVPSCFMRDFGAKMIRYAGSNELAYLHPKRFTPNPIKIDPLRSNQPFFVVRYVSWDASHDHGEGGLSAQGKQDLLALLQQHGRVVLSVEKQAPVLLGQASQPDRPLPADSMHHLLAFATAYIGEGVTAASEAAILGTPSLLINSREVGYIKEQAEVYQLTYRFADEASAFAKLRHWLAQRDLKNVWQLRREVLLRDKIDVTSWLDTFLHQHFGQPS
jgi:hypothetical protein